MLSHLKTWYDRFYKCGSRYLKELARFLIAGLGCVTGTLHIVVVTELGLQVEGDILTDGSDSLCLPNQQLCLAVWSLTALLALHSRALPWHWIVFYLGHPRPIATFSPELLTWLFSWHFCHLLHHIYSDEASWLPVSLVTSASWSQWVSGVARTCNARLHGCLLIPQERLTAACWLSSCVHCCDLTLNTSCCTAVHLTRQSTAPHGRHVSHVTCISCTLDRTVDVDMQHVIAIYSLPANIYSDFM